MTDQPVPLPSPNAGATPDPLRPAAPARRFKTGRTIGALILREMQTTYGRSPGGYVWTLLEPVGGIAVLTFILSTGFRIREPSLGTNFPLFLATGLLVLTMFMTVAGKAASSIGSNRALLFYPGVKYTDAIIAGFILTVLTQVLVIYIIFVGIHLLYGVTSILDLRAVFSSFMLTALLGIGVGTLNCFLFEVYPLWGNIWRVITRPLFLISCVIFTFEDIPVQYQDIAWWNPIIHVIAIMRRGFYPSYDADYASPIYVGLVGSITLMLGLLFLHRFHRDILNR
ncbi:MAG: ABC transporter permease [Pseudomonadota bacterium]